jgi:Zn-dependent protease with chaperone function
MSLLLPAGLAILIAVIAGLAPLPLRPSIAIRLFSALAAMTAGLGLVAMAVLSAGFLGGQPAVTAIIEWCPAVPLHHRVGWLVGIPSLIGLALATHRVRRVLRRRRWAVEGTEGKRVAVLAQAEPIAYAAPGSPGCIVVSSGLLGALGPRERQVVFAHERAHLDQHHHRHLLVGALSCAVLPLLVPLARRLRHATERCADEAAVLAMGGDRELVATAIARAALVSSPNATVGSFGGGSVPARVAALLSGPTDPLPMALGLVAASVLSAALVGASTIQVHHFAQLIAHVCGR